MDHPRKFKATDRMEATAPGNSMVHGFVIGDLHEIEVACAGARDIPHDAG